MEFVTGNLKQLYKKYLFASLFGAVVTSVYSFIDAIAIGQSVGPTGSAAMAIITPMYSITMFLSIICGIGGSVLMTNAKAANEEEKGNAYFSASFVLLLSVAALSWLIFALFNKSIFTFFGADAELMPTVIQYARWIIAFFPMFIAITYLGAVVRNDGNPNLVMIAMIIGGCINAFGDWFLCFPMDLGMDGAAIATVTGTTTQVLIMASHFFSKKCHVRFVKPFDLVKAFRKIISIGFGTGIIDLGTVILSILINNQIMKYGSTAALAIYGVIVTIASLLQSLFSGVGQAIQPLVSANYGAGKTERVCSLWKMGFLTCLGMGVVFTALAELFPTQIISIFMDATPDVLDTAPGIIRPYFIYLLFLCGTILPTYYLQAMKFGTLSMVISFMRGLLVSGILVLVLPLRWGIVGVWAAIPTAELIVAVFGLAYIHHIHKHKI